MNKWESKKPHKDGVWVSEIRLKSVSSKRKGKVNKLLQLLGEVFDETISGDN